MGNTCTGSNKILPFHAGGSANLVLLGLNNAGKSTLLARLRQEDSTTDTVPTVGVAPLSHLYYRGKAVTIQDVAGAAQYRGAWQTLFPDVHGIVFVVDSTDRDRLAEARRELHTAALADQCIGKPILILANKQDQGGAMRPKDVATELGLDDIVTARTRCVGAISVRPSELRAAGRGGGDDEEEPARRPPRRVGEAVVVDSDDEEEEALQAPVAAASVQEDTATTYPSPVRALLWLLRLVHSQSPVLGPRVAASRGTSPSGHRGPQAADWPTPAAGPPADGPAERASATTGERASAVAGGGARAAAPSPAVGIEHFSTTQTSGHFGGGGGFAPPAPAPVSTGATMSATLHSSGDASSQRAGPGFAPPAPAPVSDRLMQSTTLDTRETSAGAARQEHVGTGTATASGVLPGVPGSVLE